MGRPLALSFCFSMDRLRTQVSRLPTKPFGSFLVNVHPISSARPATVLLLLAPLLAASPALGQTLSGRAW
jgi:hypothetical protein